MRQSDTVSASGSGTPKPTCIFVHKRCNDSCPTKISSELLFTFHSFGVAAMKDTTEIPLPTMNFSCIIHPAQSTRQSSLEEGNPPGARTSCPHMGMRAMRTRCPRSRHSQRHSSFPAFRPSGLPLFRAGGFRRSVAEKDDVSAMYDPEGVLLQSVAT